MLSLEDHEFQRVPLLRPLLGVQEVQALQAILSPRLNHFPHHVLTLPFHLFLLGRSLYSCRQMHLQFKTNISTRNPTGTWKNCQFRVAKSNDNQSLYLEIHKNLGFELRKCLYCKGLIQKFLNFNVSTEHICWLGKKLNIKDPLNFILISCSDASRLTLT